MKRAALFLSLIACGWSAAAYLTGAPKDKPRFWADLLYPEDPNVGAAWAEYEAAPSFHLLKNLLVEHVRSRPQYWAKALSMVVLFMAAAWLATVLLAMIL